MRRIRLTLAFDGTEFSGWQRQKARRTVQGVLEVTLGRILRERIRVVGCGRLDAGAHALHHVSHFDTNATMTPEDLHRALNALLPEDVVVHGVGEASPDFHAQRSALHKTYEYVIWNSAIRPLWERRYVWAVPMPLNIESMRRGASALVGRRDFAAFRNVGSSVKTTVRDLKSIEIERDGVRIKIRATASGFLKQMVRVIVGTLVQVGFGRMDSDRVAGILEGGDRSRAGRTAPSRGLTLVDVRYAET